MAGCTIGLKEGLPILRLRRKGGKKACTQYEKRDKKSGKTIGGLHSL
jgi:hypothetical protein